jgi:hypothetical protein
VHLKRPREEVLELVTASRSVSSYRPSAESLQAMERFVAAIPGADAVLTEHLNDNDEMLPHLLMADLRRFFVSAVEAGDEEVVTAFVVAVEQLASSPLEDVRDTVDVSFIEDLVLGADDPRKDAAIEAMRPLMGPATAQSLALSERHIR